MCPLRLWRTLHFCIFLFFVQANSSAERACLLGAVRCHKVPSDDKNRMRGQALMSAIQEDRRNGLIPFFVRCHGSWRLLTSNDRQLFEYLWRARWLSISVGVPIEILGSKSAGTRTVIGPSGLFRASYRYTLSVLRLIIRLSAGLLQSSVHDSCPYVRSFGARAIPASHLSPPSWNYDV